MKHKEQKNRTGGILHVLSDCIYYLSTTFVYFGHGNFSKLKENLPMCGLADSWMTKASETPT